MSVFWIVVALFVGGALLMLMPALLRPAPRGVTVDGANLGIHRDQWREAERDLAAGLITPERHAQVRVELEARVLDELDSEPVAVATTKPAWRTAAALALVVSVGTVLVYRQLGSPGSAAQVVSTNVRHPTTPEQIRQMVTALAERLKAQPDDAEGWLMLGRSYTVLGRYRDAATALRRAQSLLPGNPEVLTDLADVLGMAQGKRLSGEPARLVQQALDINPRHVKALALAGSVSFEARDYGAARQYWQRLLAEVPADSQVALSFRGSINEASALESGRASTTAAAAAHAASAVRGRVEISPELASRLAPGDTLFVFARAEQGPRMPLAILRRNLPALPFDFALDDSMAMSPDLKLSGFARVIVSARVSRSGNATPQGGDLVGQSVAVAPGAEGLRLVIDHVQP